MSRCKKCKQPTGGSSGASIGLCETHYKKRPGVQGNFGPNNPRPGGKE